MTLRLVQVISELPEGFDGLLDDSVEDGFHMLERLKQEYEDGSNRFQQEGEILFALYEDEELIAIGGLNRCRHAHDATAARLRRVYVRRDHRGIGVGKHLTTQLIGHAYRTFGIIRLKTDRPEAAAFYESLGFVAAPGPGEATHMLELKR